MSVFQSKSVQTKPFFLILAINLERKKEEKKRLHAMKTVCYLEKDGETKMQKTKTAKITVRLNPFTAMASLENNQQK